MKEEKIKEIEKQIRKEFAQKGYQASLAKLSKEERMMNSKKGNDKKKELRLKRLNEKKRAEK